MRQAARVGVFASLLIASACLAANAFAASCRFVKIATLPIEFKGRSPVIDGSVNGHAMTVLVDSGASATSLTRSLADRAGLALSHSNTTSFGVGGESQRYTARVDEVSFGPVRWKRANLAVVWSLSANAPLDALLGADFLFSNDIEMVWSEKQIRFFQPEGCADAFLAYWDADASVVAMSVMGPGDSRQVITVEVNGTKMRALIDSGASHSVIDSAAAARVGVTPTSSSAIRTGKTGGIGTRDVDTWSAAFERVSIGAETIENTRLTVMDMWGAVRADSNNWATAEMIADQPEMLLGADFLRSHRVLFAASQRRFYFSYIGGAVFQAD